MYWFDLNLLEMVTLNIELAGYHMLVIMCVHYSLRHDQCHIEQHCHLNGTSNLTYLCCSCYCSIHILSYDSFMLKHSDSLCPILLLVGWCGWLVAMDIEPHCHLWFEEGVGEGWLLSNQHQTTGTLPNISLW